MPASAQIENENDNQDYKESMSSGDKTMAIACGIMCLPLLIMIFPPLLFIIIGGMCVYIKK